MSSETTPTRGAGSHFGSFVLLVAVAAGGAFVGMRWHTTLERLLVPSAGQGQMHPEAHGGHAHPTDEGDRTDAKQLWTCGMHPQVIQDHPGDCPICHMKLTPLASGGASHTSDGHQMVSIDPAIVQNMGVRTVEVSRGALPQAVRVTAMINEAEPSHRDINLRVSGWIQTLYANVDGMEVKKGDALFDLYSPELRLAIEELIAARRIAPANAHADDAMHDTGSSLVAAARSRLLALGLTDEQITRLGELEHAPEIVPIVAPMDGHVTEKTDVYAGSAVTSGQRVMRLAQRTTMWVEARVPESQIGRVRVGQRASVRVEAFPDRPFESEVTFIHPHFDEMTRTAMVRMAVHNHDHALHQGMFATVNIDVGAAEAAVLIPREAIIDSGESKVVFVDVGDGRFEPRTIATGQDGERGLVQVVSGLEPGERVVASGQFLIDSESRLREAIAKFLGRRSAVPESQPPARGVASAPAGPARAIIAPELVDAIVGAYLPLAESLGATQESPTPLDVNALIAAIRAAREQSTVQAPAPSLAAAVSAAEAMRGQPIDAQRMLFKKLSAALIALLDTSPPSAGVGGSLYIVNCPMADADWIQRTQEIANPYYADDMKQCGGVVRPVVSKGAN